MLLVHAGQEAGHVHEGQHRHVERVAGAHEAGGLLGGVDVQTARELHRLVGDDADRVALDPPEPGEDVRREQRLRLEELGVVHDVFDHRVHVVRLVGAVRDERVQLQVLPGDGQVRLLGEDRGLGEVVGAGTTAAA